MPLPILVFLALAVFAAALLGSPHIGRVVTLHLVLAVGAMPLIFGAMSHFIPVLTRTRAAPTSLMLVPLLALSGGVLAVASFMVPDRVWGQVAGALLAMLAASALLVWSRKRRASMLGTPHPGLAWYEAALACLVLALFAILTSAFCPRQTVALRHFHLHLNTLGFIGLTAVGTLAVLQPTVAGRPDPQVASRLRRDLPWAVAGTLLVAIGSGWFGALAWLGGVLWMIPLLRLGASWLRLYRAEIVSLHGAAPLLAAALAGFALSLVFGAIASISGRTEPTSIFVVALMLPLVTGAASQLLPVWLHPGVQTTWHARMRQRLGRYGGLRALFFGIAGIASGFGLAWGMLLGAATLVWFLAQTAIALLFNPMKGTDA